MRIHFIAIGGTVMHDLAIALSKKGYLVTGSDDFIYEPSRSQLQQAHLLPEELGWFPDKITEDLEAVILGMHSHEDNPELLKAKELGLNIYSYPEFIYEMSREKTRVVISGSFGKTTITSMIMHVLNKLGRSFDYVVGAQFEEFEHTVSLSKEAPIIIIEGDDYPASPEDKRPKMLVYHANIALISGITWDHKNVFLTFEDYVEQFKLLIESIEENGTLVYNKEDKRVQALVSANTSKINKHGYRIPEYTINKGVTYISTPNGEVPLSVFGKYNLSNIAGAYSVCEWLGISRTDFYTAIQDFKGASRRLEYVNNNESSIIYQDFAGTPDKIESAILALKEQYPDKKLMTVVEFPPNLPLDRPFFESYTKAFDLVEFPSIFINQEMVNQKKNAELTDANFKDIYTNDKFQYFPTLQDLENYLKQFNSDQVNLLLVTSSNFAGTTPIALSELFIS